nr:hypothetical protein [Lachnospiraceae bacterium]
MPKLKKNTAPPKMEFKSGFLRDGDVNNIDDNSIDRRKRSFMDSGETVFQGPGMDPDSEKLIGGNTRDSVAAGVRNTLLQRMKKENDESSREADEIMREHADYTQNEMRPAIGATKAKFRQYKVALAQAYQAQSLLGNDAANEAFRNITELINGENSDNDEAIARINASLSVVADALARINGQGRGQGAEVDLGAQGAQGNLLLPAAADVAILPPGQRAEAGAANPLDQRGEGILIQPGAQPIAGGVGQVAGPEAEGIDQDQDEPRILQGVRNPQPSNPAAQQPAVRVDQVGVNGNQYLGENFDVAGAQRELDRRAEDLAALNAIKDTIAANRNAGNRPGKIMKFFSGTEKKARKAVNDAQETHNEALRLKQSLREKADKWSRYRQVYREKTFRKRYREFDRLATSYFAFSRKLNDQQRTLPDGFSKKIAEYTGVYDDAQLTYIMNNISQNPFSDPPVLRHVRSKAMAGAGSLNTDATDRPVKYHRGIVMTAFSEGNSTLGDQVESGQAMVRMKLNNSFRGYKARSQVQIVQGKKRLVDRFAGGANTDHVQNGEQDAANLNLAVNERGTNAELLYSENSAKIYKARTATFGGTQVNGFYMNGEFISADYNSVQTMDQTGGLRNPNWDKADDEETLRNAMRRSDFFRHVNAKTIQYYMSYDPADQFKVGEKRQKILANQAGANDINSNVSIIYNRVIDSIQNNITDFANIINTQSPPGQQETYMHIYATILQNESAARNLGILFLGDDDPAIWKFGERVARDLGGRFKRVLSYTTEGGQAMRMELLTEFSNDRSTDLADITGTLLTPNRLQQYKEDLAARRDGFFSFTNLKQSFFDGSLLKNMAGVLTAGTLDLRNMNMSDATGFSELFNSFNNSYGQLLSSSSTNLGIALAPIPGTLKLLGDDAAAQTSASVGNSIFSLLKIISDIYKITRAWKERKEKSAWKNFLAFGTLIATTAKDIVGLVKYWLGKIQLVSKTNDILGAVVNAIEILMQITTIVTSSITITQIKKTDQDITTALQQSRDRQNTLLAGNPNRQISEADMENDTQKMGLAASRNAQGQYFLSLARSNASKARKAAISGMTTSGLSLAGNTLGAYNVVKLPFMLLAQASKFVGWCIGKHHDSKHFAENVAMQL